VNEPRPKNLSEPLVNQHQSADMRALFPHFADQLPIHEFEPFLAHRSLSHALVFRAGPAFARRIGF